MPSTFVTAARASTSSPTTISLRFVDNRAAFSLQFKETD